MVPTSMAGTKTRTANTQMIPIRHTHRYDTKDEIYDPVAGSL